MDERTPFEDLVAVMARLRGPDGCPWDRQQTLESLRGFLVEETYELLEAIDRREPGHLREELGDLLLEVVFLAEICSEEGLFTMDDVVRGIRDKLVRRHPHVFGGKQAGSPHEAIQHWEEIKNKERAASPGGKEPCLLDGVPVHLPALLRAHRLSTKASLSGFDWKAIEDLHAKLTEEIAEFRDAAAAGDRAGMEEELGDLLFTVANVGRYSGIDPEMALQAANRKFISRFLRVEEELRRRGVEPGKATLEEMEAIWDRVKADDRAGGGGPAGDQSTSSR
ncbi:MAG TPA: nucleoside triphosphate pyrophosphohydrolase [Candidatus Polarisedimenticolia bacterium]